MHTKLHDLQLRDTQDTRCATIKSLRIASNPTWWAN